VACTLSVIGSSWTCLILRHLLQHGARRFQDFQDSLYDIAPTTLSERVRTLEQHGVAERRFYSMSPPRAEYVLTQKGRDLGPIVGAMRKLGTLVLEVTASPGPTRRERSHSCWR
jgi:DNA-binding HxlR family transcriptional regulator